MDGEDICVCKTGFHGECCEHGYDLTAFIIVYIIIILLCFVFVCSMFCVGEYRHKHVLQAIPTTYETEFEDWEEEKPLLEPKFVWTAPHDTKKVGLFYKSWDTYSEFSSRAGSVMSVGSFSWETNLENGEKTFKGHDAILELLDIFEIAQLQNFHDLDRETRANLVHKLAPRLDFEEQIKLRSFDTLSEEENMEMVSRLLELADRATAIKDQEAKELKELEDNPVFEDMDNDVIEKMGNFNELDDEERSRVIEQLEGLLSEKDKIKLQNFNELSKREQEIMLDKLKKLQGVALKVSARTIPEDDGHIELTTSRVTEGIVPTASLRTAIKSEAIAEVLKTIGMSIGILSSRPEARLEIRSRILGKLMLMTEEEIIALCVKDGLDETTMEEMSHIERVAYLADRASCACVADLDAIQEEIKEEEARAAEEAAKAREKEEAGPSSISSMSGVMSMSSSDDDDDDTDKPAKRMRKVDLSKIKWSGPPKGAKPGFNRGMLSLGVLSTSVKKFKEREKIGIVQGRVNTRSQLLSERLVRTLSTKSHDESDPSLKQPLRKRLSNRQGELGLPQWEEDFDDESEFSSK